MGARHSEEGYPKFPCKFRGKLPLNGYGLLRISHRIFKGVDWTTEVGAFIVWIMLLVNILIGIPFQNVCSIGKFKTVT